MSNLLLCIFINTWGYIGVKECLRRMCINIKYMYAIINVVGIYTLHTHTQYIYVSICAYRYRLLYSPLLTPTINGSL